MEVKNAHLKEIRTDTLRLFYHCTLVLPDIKRNITGIDRWETIQDLTARGSEVHGIESREEEEGDSEKLYGYLADFFALVSSIRGKVHSESVEKHIEQLEKCGEYLFTSTGAMLIGAHKKGFVTELSEKLRHIPTLLENISTDRELK